MMPNGPSRDEETSRDPGLEAAFARMVQQAEAAPEFVARVLAKADQAPVRRPARVSWLGRLPWGVDVAVAAILILALVGAVPQYLTWFYTYVRGVPSTEMVATLQAKLAKREATLEAEQRERERVERVVVTLQGKLGERDAALRLLSTPQVNWVRLAGLPPSPRASAHLLWNPATQAGVLLASGLPQIPRDRVYELWAFVGNEPVPAGIFQVDEAGHGFLRLPPLPTGKRFGKFAVTSEPAGGVPKPTGPVHLSGSL